MHLRIDDICCSHKWRTPAVTSAMTVSSTWPLSWAGCGRYSCRWGLAISARKANERCPLRCNPTMQVRFLPCKVCIVKSSCNEDMVNTGNLPLKGTLFLQQKAGDSSEISAAELFLFKYTCVYPTEYQWNMDKTSSLWSLWLMTVNAIVFSCCFCAMFSKFTLQVVWNCIVKGPHLLSY